MTPVQIRMAQESDAPAIQAMIAALAAETLRTAIKVFSVDDVRRDGFGADPAFECLIAERAGEAIGLALFFAEYSTWRGQRGVYVQDLYVTPADKGAGIGETLMRAVARRAREKGASYIRLSVDHENERAMKFYRRLGFETRDDRMFIILGEAFAAISDRA